MPKRARAIISPWSLQLTPDVQRLIRWAEAQRLLATRQEDDLGYALHLFLRRDLQRLLDDRAHRDLVLDHHSARSSCRPASSQRRSRENSLEASMHHRQFQRFPDGGDVER